MYFDIAFGFSIENRRTNIFGRNRNGKLQSLHETVEIEFCQKNTVVIYYYLLLFLLQKIQFRSWFQRVNRIYKSQKIFYLDRKIIRLKIPFWTLPTPGRKITFLRSFKISNRIQYLSRYDPKTNLYRYCQLVSQK